MLHLFNGQAARAGAAERRAALCRSSRPEGREGGRGGGCEVEEGRRKGERERGKGLPVKSTNASSSGSRPSRFPSLTRVRRAGRREGLWRRRVQVLKEGGKKEGRKAKVRIASSR